MSGPIPPGGPVESGAEPPVVVRRSRSVGLILTGIFGFLAAHLTWYTLRSDEGGLIGRLLAVLFVAIFAGIALVGARLLIRAPRIVVTRETITTAHYPGPSSIRLADATSLAFSPAARTTWTASTSPAPGVRRLDASLRVSSADGTVTFESSQRAWPAVVDYLSTWAQRRPDLLVDDATAHLFAEVRAHRPQPGALISSPKARSASSAVERLRGGAIVRLLILWTLWVGGLTWLWFTAVTSVLRDVVGLAELAPFILGLAVLLTAISWLPMEIGRVIAYGLWQAARGDPRWLFRPTADGRYHWLASGGRSLARTDADSTGALGTAMRWVLVIAAWVVSALPIAFITAAALHAAR